MSPARAAYALAMRLGVPLYAVRLAWRARREPLYGAFIGERFGFYAGPAPAPGALWIHSVSLGETRAAAPLVAALRQAWPGLRLVWTQGTATGRAAATPLLREGDVQAWLPWDTPGAARRFLRRFRPVAGVLMETEIWPNLLAEAQAAGVPMVLANARLSARSRRRGARVDALLRPAFASLAEACAQSDADAARLREAGVGRAEVLGNLKYDIAPDAAVLARGAAWKHGLGRPAVLGAITREGEEAMLLDAWRALAEPRPLLVIVPRHPQRFDAVAELVVAAGFTLSRRSLWPTAGLADEAREAEVWLGDSMLEMPAWYALAEAALLGGSFAPLGGQNLIEAAACGCPVVAGPHTFNFAEAAELAIEAGAASRAADMAEAVGVAHAWARDPVERERRSQAGLAFAAQHRGAAPRMAAHIAAWALRPG